MARWAACSGRGVQQNVEHGPSAVSTGLPAANREQVRREMWRGLERGGEEVVQKCSVSCSDSVHAQRTCSFSSTSRPALPLMICNSSLLVLA